MSVGGARQERGQADVHCQATLDPPGHVGSQYFLLVESLLDLLPDFGAVRLQKRQPGEEPPGAPMLSTVTSIS